MAKPGTIRGGKLKVEIGDRASPEVFIAPCGFNEKSFVRSKSLNESNIPDCDDPDAPTWVGRDVASLTWSVTGQGVLAKEAVDPWDEFFDSNDSRNVRITETWPDRTVVYTGAAHLESLEIGAPNGNRVTINVTLQSDGPLTRTPAL